MNARQTKKLLKKKINTLELDNKLMRDIIADSPTMQELYDLYNKPKFVTHTTMRFQEYRVKRAIPRYMADVDGVVEHTKQSVAMDLFEGIKDSIVYEIDNEHITPTITANIFVGIKD